MKRLSNAQYQKYVAQRAKDTWHENEVARLLKQRDKAAFHKFFDKTTNRRGDVIRNPSRVSDAPLAKHRDKPVDTAALSKAEEAHRRARLG